MSNELTAHNNDLGIGMRVHSPRSGNIPPASFSLLSFLCVGYASHIPRPLSWAGYMQAFLAVFAKLANVLLLIFKQQAFTYLTGSVFSYCSTLLLWLVDYLLISSMRRMGRMAFSATDFSTLISLVSSRRQM